MTYKFSFIGIALMLGLVLIPAKVFAGGHGMHYPSADTHHESVTVNADMHDCCVISQAEHNNHGDECDGDCSLCACAACSTPLTTFLKSSTIRFIGLSQTIVRSHFRNTPAYYSIWVPPKIG